MFIWIDFKFGQGRLSRQEVDECSQAGLEKFKTDFLAQWGEEPDEEDDDDWARYYDLTLEQVVWVIKQDYNVCGGDDFDELWLAIKETKK